MKKAGPRADRTRWGVLFALPVCVLIAVFVLIPIVYVFYLSMFDWKIPQPMKFIGFEGYARVLKDKMFWNAIGVNFRFMLWGVVLWTVVPLLAATCLYEIRRGAGFFRATFLFPTVLSVTIIGIVFKTLFGHAGRRELVDANVPHHRAHHPADVCGCGGDEHHRGVLGLVQLCLYHDRRRPRLRHDHHGVLHLYQRVPLV